MRKVLNKILNAVIGPSCEDGVTSESVCSLQTNLSLTVTPSSRRGPVGLCLILFFLLMQSAVAQTIRPTTFDDRGVCESSKGVWRQFGNGCADFCHDKFDLYAMCTQAVVYSCECGKNRCWNGETCVTLKNYKKVFDVEQEKERKILDAAKEKRKAESLENEEAIMTKLVPPAASDQNAANSDPSKTPAPVVTPDKFLTPNPTSNSAVAVPQDPEPTSPITQILAPVPLTNSSQTNQGQTNQNQDPAKVDLPDFFLKKQAQAAAKTQDQAKDSKAKDTKTKDSLPSTLPEVPLPN